MAKNTSDRPQRMKPKDIPQPPTGVGNPGSYPFGPGEVQGTDDSDGGWTKKPGVKRGGK